MFPFSGGSRLSCEKSGSPENYHARKKPKLVTGRGPQERWPGQPQDATSIQPRHQKCKWRCHFAHSAQRSLRLTPAPANIWLWLHENLYVRSLSSSQLTHKILRIKKKKWCSKWLSLGEDCYAAITGTHRHYYHPYFTNAETETQKAQLHKTVRGEAGSPTQAAWLSSLHGGTPSTGLLDIVSPAATPRDGSPSHFFCPPI